MRKGKLEIKEEDPTGEEEKEHDEKYEERKNRDRQEHGERGKCSLEEGYKNDIDDKKENDSQK